MYCIIFSLFLFCRIASLQIESCLLIHTDIIEYHRSLAVNSVNFNATRIESPSRLTCTGLCSISTYTVRVSVRLYRNIGARLASSFICNHYIQNMRTEYAHSKLTQMISSLAYWHIFDTSIYHSPSLFLFRRFRRFSLYIKTIRCLCNQYRKCSCIHYFKHTMGKKMKIRVNILK